MADIRITPELLKAKANEVRTYKNEHDEAITKITSLVNSLTEIWTGEAQTAFSNTFAGMKSTFQQFSQELENFAKFMDTAATELENKDKELANRANNI